MPAVTSTSRRSQNSNNAINYNEHCPICKKRNINLEEHISSDEHRLNYILELWNKHRKGLVKSRHGIKIEANIYEFSENIISNQTEESKGRYTLSVYEDEMIQLENGLTYTFTVKNVKKEGNMILMGCDTLHPTESFVIIDPKNILSERKMAELEPGATYTIKVRFKVLSVGEFRMSVAFILQDKESTKQFTIVRELMIFVINQYADEITMPSHKKSPFTGQEWHNVAFIKPLNYRQINAYKIPGEIIRIITYGMQETKFSGAELMTCLKIQQYLQDGCTPENYRYYFHNLLWLDERGAEVKIRKYNMENVEIRIRNTLLELTVPGLAEKRPSLIVGDEISIKVCNTNTAYMGTILIICEEVIKIGNVHPDFISMVYNAPNQALLVDVKFAISRLKLARMHTAVDLCCCEDKMKLLFPSRNENRVITENINRFYNDEINKNNEQKLAVTNIVSKSSGTAPFIVYGPPGTGKTITIVEAIIQIATKDPQSKILICAPANAACDMLTVKLAQHFSKKQLIRMHSDNCDWTTVPEIAKQYSNRSGSETKKLTAEELSLYKIVVTTLVLVGRYINKFPRTHVFIDEAAQASEPEAIIAIGGILVPNGQLVLAGDHQQLGPSVDSSVAEKYGLRISLLERLIKTIPFYAPTAENTDYIVKLKLNYRSHEQIIHIPNHLFYENELQAVSEQAKNDKINKIILRVTKNQDLKPQAIEFYGVSGQEEKEGCSPSFYNTSEIRVVMKYVQELLHHPEVEVQQKEIGIIAPYIRQVMRIRKSLEKEELFDVEVGTTETFQGREKRIIIISTVRAKANLLLVDKKYNLGFVANKERFNVAITRAMSKLIIVGNPYLLWFDPVHKADPECTDDDPNSYQKWRKLIEFCQNLKSYRGCPFIVRDDDTKNKIAKKFAPVKMIDSQYNRR